MDQPLTIADNPDGKVGRVAAGTDPLLKALEYLARHHKKPFSKASALTGLPLIDGWLSLSVFEDACHRLGLQAEIVERTPSSVPGIVCPYVVFFKNGDVGIVTEKAAGSNKLSVVLPGKSPVKTVSRKDLDRECNDQVIYVTPDSPELHATTETRMGQPRKGHWLWSTLVRFWPSWTQVVFAALFINILGLALPLFVMNVYDRVIPFNAIPTLWALAAGVALALVFDFLLRMVRALIIDNSGRRIDMKISSDLFEHALDAKMAERPPRAGDIATQIREFESVRDFFTSASITSAIDLVFIGLFLFVLWIIVGPLALVPLAAVPLVLVVTLLIQIPLGRSVAKSMRSSTNRHAVLVESLVGVETVKAIGAEGSFQRRWEAAVADSVRATSSTRFWSSLAIFFGMFVQQGVSVVIIVWGVYLVTAGEISVGALIASNILAGRVLSPLGGIAMTLSRIQQSRLSLKALNALMGLNRDHVSQDRQAGEIEQGRLEFRDASFSYPDQEIRALDQVALRIVPGERVGIVGRVGSGKSTLGKVLCGLYDTDAGAILLDDTDIRNRNVADLREAVSYVGQDPDLFSGTIRENILMGRPEAAARFDQAAMISGVASFAQMHPMGLEMPVGERGQLISGGQRQAVALARALVGEPRILYLDEPTGAMDNTTEAVFVRNMAQLLDPAVTLIVATHRTSLLELVDRIIVMEAGKIISDGPKAEILDRLNPNRAKTSGKAKTK